MSTVPAITRQEIESKLAAGDDVVIVEALGPMYFDDAHLPGARNLPHDRDKHRHQAGGIWARPLRALWSFRSVRPHRQAEQDADYARRLSSQDRAMDQTVAEAQCDCLG